jgi:hypothetical protein
MSVTTAFQSMNGGECRIVIVDSDIQSGANTSTLKILVRDSASRKFNLTIWFAFAQPQRGPGYALPVSKLDIRQMGSVTMASADGGRAGAAAAFRTFEQLYIERFRAGKLDGVFACIELLMNSHNHGGVKPIRALTHPQNLTNDLNHGLDRAKQRRCLRDLFDHRLVEAFLNLWGARTLDGSGLRNSLLTEFISEQRRQAPAYYLTRFLSDKEMDCAAVLFSLIQLVNHPAQRDFRMQTLETLIKGVMTKRRIVNVKSVEKEIRKVFAPSKKGWATIVSNKDELDSFVNGRVGELTGLFGELRTLAELRREVVRPGTKVMMGEHIRVSGMNSRPEVDLRLVTVEGQEILVEIAATIQKLRDKLRNNSEAGAQRANYERLLLARPNGQVVLAYAASVPKWFELFISSGRNELPSDTEEDRWLKDDSVASRVSKLDRALLVDGILMSPEELNDAWKRREAIMKETHLTYDALNVRISNKRISAAFLFRAPFSKVLKHLALRPMPGHRLSTRAVAGSQCDLDDLSDQPPVERIEAHFLRKDNPFAVLADL